MSEEQKNIEVISGDGSELNISPVYDHISAGKPSIEDKKKNIIIPCTDKTYLNKQQENKEDNEENVSSNLEDQNDVNEDTDSNS